MNEQVEKELIDEDMTRNAEGKEKEDGGKSETTEEKLEIIEGLGLIIFCGIVIMLGPIAKILAWLGLAYGAWKLWQGFKN